VEGSLSLADRLKIRVQGAVARTASGLPASMQRALSGPPIVRGGQTLHHEAQLALRLQQLARPPMLDELPVPRARRRVAVDALSAAGRPVAMEAVRELTVTGGPAPLPARLYVPGSAGAGLLVYYHGGGMVVCDLDTHDCVCRLLAAGAGARVLSVGYRLAPEHCFPAAYEDAWAAFRFALESAESLGADPGLVAVGGDSAGGNLAAGVAQRAAAEGGSAPALQLLFYPWLDLSRERRSYELFGEGFYLTRRDLAWYRSHYVAAAEDVSDPRCSPLLASTVEGVAPAYIAVAGFDPLRDEGEEYAARLRAAGVWVALHRHGGLFHGFANSLGVGRAGREAVLEAAGALRLTLAG
jgi:acetyl esterase